MYSDIFEPLGSNCEFGFVLQQLENYTPSLFRWTSIQLDDLARLFDANFLGAFERSKIKPHTDDMVLDVEFQWAFHSALKSENGAFSIEASRLEKLFRIERSRVHQLIEKFRSRLQSGEVLCVFSADGLDDAQVLGLKAAIDRVAGNNGNGLIVVSGDEAADAALGHLRALADRTWRGRVSQLAPWFQADAADYENWQSVLKTGSDLYLGISQPPTGHAS